MAYGYWLQAEYESGFILTEDDVDHSPYDVGKNIFNAILEGRPTEAGHGRMVRFSLIPGMGQVSRFDIDWCPLWETDNPRPVYYRKMTKTDQINQHGEMLTDAPAVCESHHFGFQYNDEHGKNVTVVEEIQ